MHQVENANPALATRRERKQVFLGAKPPHRARRAPGHRTHAAEAQASPSSPETRPPIPRVAHHHTPTPKSTQTPLPLSACSARPPLTRRQSPGRPPSPGESPTPRRPAPRRRCAASQTANAGRQTRTRKHTRSGKKLITNQNQKPRTRGKAVVGLATCPPLGE